MLLSSSFPVGSVSFYWQFLKLSYYHINIRAHHVINKLSSVPPSHDTVDYWKSRPCLLLQLCLQAQKILFCPSLISILLRECWTLRGADAHAQVRERGQGKLSKTCRGYLVYSVKFWSLVVTASGDTELSPYRCQRRICCWLRSVVLGLSLPVPLGQYVVLATCTGNKICLQDVQTFFPPDYFSHVENFLSVYFSSLEEGRFVSGNCNDMSHAGLEYLETIYVNAPKTKMKRFIYNHEMTVQTMLVFLARGDSFPVA